MSEELVANSEQEILSTVQEQIIDQEIPANLECESKQEISESNQKHIEKQLEQSEQVVNQNLTEFQPDVQPENDENIDPNVVATNLGQEEEDLQHPQQQEDTQDDHQHEEFKEGDEDFNQRQDDNNSNDELKPGELEQAISINKMQHQYIQNLQKANLFLKAKLKELQDKKYDPCAQLSNDETGFERRSPEGEYELVPIGRIDQINREEMKKEYMERQLDDQAHRSVRPSNSRTSQNEHQKEPSTSKNFDEANRFDNRGPRNIGRGRGGFNNDYRRQDNYQSDYRNQATFNQRPYNEQRPPYYKNNYQQPYNQSQPHQNRPYQKPYENNNYHGNRNSTTYGQNQGRPQSYGWGQVNGNYGRGRGDNFGQDQNERNEREGTGMQMNQEGNGRGRGGFGNYQGRNGQGRGGYNNFNGGYERGQGRMNNFQEGTSRGRGGFDNFSSIGRGRGTYNNYESGRGRGGFNGGRGTFNNFDGNNGRGRGFDNAQGSNGRGRGQFERRDGQPDQVNRGRGQNFSNISRGGASKSNSSEQCSIGFNDDDGISGEKQFDERGKGRGRTFDLNQNRQVYLKTEDEQPRNVEMFNPMCQNQFFESLERSHKEIEKEKVFKSSNSGDNADFKYDGEEKAWKGECNFRLDQEEEEGKEEGIRKLSYKKDPFKEQVSAKEEGFRQEPFKNDPPNSNTDEEYKEEVVRRVESFNDSKEEEDGKAKEDFHEEYYSASNEAKQFQETVGGQDGGECQEESSSEERNDILGRLSVALADEDVNELKGLVVRALELRMDKEFEVSLAREKVNI